ncbi:copper resistance CopC/CopD family protein [Cohnella cholangitidis]|uniref:Copper resistance protein CopC n=1 Tax=Cohnella cholangitidis TaxID=2598458 RepID=A0A7G5C2M0_9BACL|nr:copper resistance protein CopC [Cohnella cholangitidis]QMV43454.1 copper resistance protein CopC [Cohnella cholangitidis]
MTFYGMVRANARFLFHEKLLRITLLVALGLFPTLIMSGQAEAHAVLERTSPEANARMDVGPQEVEISFNERLDSGGSKLLVLNESSRDVAKGKVESINEGKGIRIALPKLSEGHYTVSYSVISADGHPISGAYVFTIGNPDPLPDASQLDPHQQIGHSHNHGSAGLDQQSFLLYSARILYYAGLLSVAGLALWGLLRKPSPVVREVYARSLGLAGKFALLATIAYVFFSLRDLGQGEPLSEWGRILTDTTIGKLYIAELLLALAAPLLPSLGAGARLIWAAIALFVEAWSGHAAAFNPIAYTVGLDLVHLLAASLWSGGLVLLLAIWYKERPEAGRFALVFSKWALISFLVLGVTGILSTLDFLPSLEYLKYTTWGKWLIAKAIVSLLVAITAFFIRRRLKKGDLPHGNLLKADVGLLSAIVITVGVLTYQTPLPVNEQLNFHQMGTEMHVTLRVSPNTPGDNQFNLKIWLPERTGKGVPKSVQLRMLPLDKEGMGFIDVPLEAYKDEEMDAFPDYTKSTYKAQGPYLPFAGQWKAQIRVTDADDTERVVETTYRIY